MSKYVRKLRTAKFRKRNKRSFDSCSSCKLCWHYSTLPCASLIELSRSELSLLIAHITEWLSWITTVFSWVVHWARRVGSSGAGSVTSAVQHPPPHRHQRQQQQQWQREPQGRSVQVGCVVLHSRQMTTWTWKDTEKNGQTVRQILRWSDDQTDIRWSGTGGSSGPFFERGCGGPNLLSS